MNGVHDLGGMDGFGPVEPEPDEPVFHAEWERRCFAITVACGFLGAWNIDMSRFARERIPPADYLRSTYYEHWLLGLETLLEETGFVARAETDARIAGTAPPAALPAREAKVLRVDDVARTLGRGGPSRVDAEVPARFAPGDRVVARNVHPPGHTRLPRYARGRRGVVARDHGVHVFPDASAMGLGKQPQHLYSVRFEARELFGDRGGAHDHVMIDLWDSHLDRCEDAR